MNKLIIIGNLTRDPETRTAPSGSTVCGFTLAVNRRKSKDNEQTDYFRVHAWNKLGDICQRYLAKGRKACVTGSVSVSSYEGKDGATRFSLDVLADDVEFLSPNKSGSGDGRSLPQPFPKDDEQYDSDANEAVGYDNGAFAPQDGNQADDDLPF